MSSYSALKTFYTVGHSTREVNELIEVLKSFAVELLVDVRSVPRSRHVPQFNLETLPVTLRQGGIEYMHMKQLGGFRKALPNSPNTGWRNASFRGYADYMQTPDFHAALNDLIALGERRSLAVMCAEVLPFRCHRSLIADALVARGYRVCHIMTVTRADEHELTAFSHVVGDQLTYPPRS